MILQSDMLDILFEGRNKDYGAYNLRKTYNDRVIKSLSAMLLLVGLFIGGYYLASAMKPKTLAGDPLFSDSVMLRVIPLPPPIEEPKLPKAPQVAQKVATIKNTPPVIVPPAEVTDPPPTIQELKKETAAISTVNEACEGCDAPVGPQSPPPGAQVGGTGTVTVAAPLPPEPEKPVTTAEKMPEFPGGMDGLRRFLGRHLRVPEEVLEVGQKVKVPVRFVVNKDGQLSGVEFLAEADEAFKKEILRVVAKMPRWIPGSQNGKNVAVYCMIPILFEVQE